MNLTKESVKTIGKKISENAVDAGLTAMSFLDTTGFKASNNATRKIIQKTEETLLDETVEGTKRRLAQKLYDNAGSIGNAAGSGLEGLMVGAATGTVVGGISGGIDKDSTFLEGAAKGTLAGGLLGGAIGATSGILHHNPELFTNAWNDYSEIAARAAKWKTNMGNGIRNRGRDIRNATNGIRNTVSDAFENFGNEDYITLSSNIYR